MHWSPRITPQNEQPTATLQPVVDHGSIPMHWSLRTLFTVGDLVHPNKGKGWKVEGKLRN